MPTTDELARTVADIAHRLMTVEAKTTLHDDQFALQSGQLRYVASRIETLDRRVTDGFAAMTARLDKMDARLDGLAESVDALPRIIAELIAKR